MKAHSIEYEARSLAGRAIPAQTERLFDLPPPATAPRLLAYVTDTREQIRPFSSSRPDTTQKPLEKVSLAREESVAEIVRFVLFRRESRLNRSWRVQLHFGSTLAVSSLYLGYTLLAARSQG